MSTVRTTGTVLDEIVARTRIDLDARQRRMSRDELQRRFDDLPAPVDLAAALNHDTVSVIAEIKRASPSRGRFPVTIDPARVAADYARGGAAGISCLTDEPYFQGSLMDLEVVSAVAQQLDAPLGVLRKDFMIDAYQVDEARAHGASCILLIVACLPDILMRTLQDYAQSLGMCVLVEVHDEHELDRALAIGPQLVGINNRDLRTLTVDLNVTKRLAPMAPSDVVLVGESGIFDQGHVRTLAGAGVDAILVGESLIVQHDHAAAVSALTGVRKEPRGQVV